MGPLTNLAQLVDTAPDLAARLRVTQMVGALNYRHPDRAEHNIRLDVPAGHRVLAAVTDGRLPAPELITSDVTFTPQLAIDAEHPIHRALAAPDAPAWARLLVAHLHRWYQSWHPSTIQHDALTLTAALELPFVDATPATVTFDAIGRMTETDRGAPVWLSRRADYPVFIAWLADALNPAGAAAAALTSA